MLRPHTGGVARPQQRKQFIFVCLLRSVRRHRAVMRVFLPIRGGRQSHNASIVGSEYSQPGPALRARSPIDSSVGSKRPTLLSDGSLITSDNAPTLPRACLATNCLLDSGAGSFSGRSSLLGSDSRGEARIASYRTLIASGGSPVARDGTRIASDGSLVKERSVTNGRQTCRRADSRGCGSEPARVCVL